MATPPACYTNNPGETTMTVWWQPPPPGEEPPGAAAPLVLEVREFPREWAVARAIDVPPGARELVVTGLVPTATFEFRLRHRLPDGSLGPPGGVATADTLAAGCTPRGEGDGSGRKRKTCAVM